MPWIKLKPIASLEGHGEAYTAYSSKLKRGFTVDALHEILAHSDKSMIPHLQDRVDNLVVVKESQLTKEQEWMHLCKAHGVHKCWGCHLGKAHKQPFHTNPERATSVGHWHLDYKSSKVPSLIYHNTGYFLYFEECSGITVACPTNNKRGSTQLANWKEIEALLEKYKHSTHTIVCDGGGEYVNDDTMHYWRVVKKHTIKITVPHTPQHNSRAERKIKTVDDKANAVLCAFQLHDKYWELAILFVVFVENRILTIHISNPPWTNLTGEIIDFSVFTMPFGTLVFAFNPTKEAEIKN